MTYLTNYNWMKKPYLDSKENHHTLTPSLFKRTATNILKIRNSILFTIIFVAFAQVCWGQVNGDYVSITNNGTWTNKATWGIYNGTSTPGTAPSPPDKTINVTIKNGFTIKLDPSSNDVNNLTIESTGKITSAGSNILTVYGDVKNDNTVGLDFLAGTITFNGSSHSFSGISFLFNLTVPSGITLNVKSNIRIANELRVDGILNPDASIQISSKLSSQTIIGDGVLQVTRCISTGTLDDDGNFINQYPKFSGRNVKIVEYVGSSAQAISPGTYFNVLKINSKDSCKLLLTAQCTSANIESGILVVVPGATLTVLGKTDLSKPECLVLQSNDTPLTGYFIHSNSFSGIGTVKVERYMSHSNNWHLYCSPIGYTSYDKGSQVSVHDFLLKNPEIPDLVNTLGSSPLGVGMRDYNTSKGDWNPYFVYPNGTADYPLGNMEIGKGFSIRTSSNLYDSTNGSTVSGSGIIDAIGIPNNNDVLSVRLTYDDVAKSTDRGWNCIGNPFTSGLDIGKFTRNSHNFDNIDKNFSAVYIWDTNAITDTSKYYNFEPSYIPINGGSDIKSIQMSQGFFVKSIPGGGSADFTSSMQYTNVSLSFKDAQIQLPSIKIFAKSQALSSFTQIKFIPNTTKGLDPGYDAGMLKANSNFALYSRLLIDNGVDFALQCLPDQDSDQYVIPIGIDCKVAGDITFTSETVNLPSGCQALLEDRLTKRFTRLDLKDAKYTTTVSADTKGPGRFFLHTSDVISSDQPIEKEPFKISKIGKTLYINGEVSNKANFYVYSVNGKQLANFKAESQVQNQFDASGLPAGVYILTCDDQNQKNSTKFVIEN